MADRREEIALKLGLCKCDEAYTSRGLTAPDCPYHSMCVSEAMDEYSKEWERKYQEANQFICDLGKLIGLDGLGYDDIKASVEDFRDGIDEKKKEMCLGLLEYVAKNISRVDRNECFIGYRGDIFTKEQLFENFL